MTDQLNKFQQLKYRKPLSVVEKKLQEMMIIPETDIRIYPVYPTGWYATVGANNRVYIFISNRGVVTLEIQPVYGFLPGGSLNIKPIEALERRESYGN